MRCPDCYGRTSTPGRCPQCRAEHLASTAGDHDPLDDEQPPCSVCGGPGGEADHDGRAGLWLCPGCQTLPLTPRQWDQVVAETPDALAGAVRWAVGDADAYPDEDPGALEAGFEPASTRVIADGGRVRRHLYLITEHEEDDRVGSVKCTSTRITNSKKNEERPIRTFEPDDGFYIAGKQVALGYVDFEDEDDMEENFGDEAKRKLADIDAKWLDKAGMDVEVPA